MNIASPPYLAPGELTFVDYELDVALVPSGEPEILDEEAFTEATVRYSYAPEFQTRCRQAVQDAVTLVRAWPVTPWEPM